MKRIAFKAVLFWIFASLSFIGVLLLGTINDIEPEGMKFYLVFASSVVICIVTSLFLFNYRIIFRHLFAIHQLLALIYITYLKIRSRRYNYLYDAALKTGSINKFYSAMLRLYDIVNEGVVTVSDLYKEV